MHLQLFSNLSHPQIYILKTDGDSCKKSFRYIGDDDADEEDDRVEPVVAEDEGDDEEGDAKEDGDAGDDVDEVLDLFGDRGLTSLETGGQTSNPGYVKSGVKDNFKQIIF